MFLNAYQGKSKVISCEIFLKILKWWQDNIDFGLMPLGNNPLPELMLAKSYEAIGCH